MEKYLNSQGYKETVVSNLSYMNSIVKLSDNRMGYVEESAGWAHMLYKPYEIAFTFFLVRDLGEEEEVVGIDKRGIQNKANGFYNWYFEPLCSCFKGEAKHYDVVGAFNYTNEKYWGQELKEVYVYDKNKAYLSHFLKGEYPDVAKGDLGLGIVEEGQIGYRTLGYKILGLAKVGEIATVRFPKAHSELLVSFAKKKGAEMTQLKRENKKEELMIMKQAINASIGITRNHNPWFYAFVVGSVGDSMRELITEDTLLCNTDSIFSLVPREDLDIGDEIGQFKVEHSGVHMVYRGSNYVLYDDKKTLTLKQRGVIKGLQDPEAFKRGEAHGAQMKYHLINNELGVKIYET